MSKTANLIGQVAVGAVVGAIAGVAMAGWAMAASLLNGDGFLMPVQLIAATAYGTNALTLTPQVLVVGLVLHMVTSVVLGAMLGPFLGSVRLLWQGQALAVAGGIGVWAVFTFAILPQSNVVMYEATQKTPVNWLIGHVIFGLVLGFAPSISAWFYHKKTV